MSQKKKSKPSKGSKEETNLLKAKAVKDKIVSTISTKLLTEKILNDESITKEQIAEEAYSFIVGSLASTMAVTPLQFRILGEVRALENAFPNSSMDIKDFDVSVVAKPKKNLKKIETDLGKMKDDAEESKKSK